MSKVAVLKTSSNTVIEDYDRLILLSMRTFYCLGMYLVILGFNQSVNITLATFIFSFASLAGAVSRIPSGLGVAEATISGLLQLFGFAPATSVGIAIIVRLGTLWYGALMGVSIYFIFKNAKKFRGGI